MNKNLPNVIIGVLLGLLVAWLLGLFSPVPTPATPEPAAKTADASAPVQPGNPAPTTAVKTAPASSVVAPSAPPVKMAQATGAPRPPAPVTLTSAQQEQVIQKVQLQAARNNLRMLSTAAQQYMLDKGVTAAGYYDLVGTDTDDYIRNIRPVAGEDYSGFYVNQSDTQVMVVLPDGTTVTYNM